ncbi:MAG TPA: DUF2062 domain-containing protein [Burkholderiales bacterium]|nr:DUF2062 domain-containing protein [Burkholderiales bacterium]
MARKLFRKYLPDVDTIRQHRYVACFGPRLQHPNLWHLHRRSVAGGVAAGMFAGLIPGSNPVQFLAASLLAIVFHVNLPIAVLVTLYSNPFTIVPLYYAAFKIGQVALFRNDNDLPSLVGIFEGKGMGEWLSTAWDWITGVGYPLIVGLPLLAILLAIAGYLLVDWGWRLHVMIEWRRRQVRRAVKAQR